MFRLGGRPGLKPVGRRETQNVAVSVRKSFLILVALIGFAISAVLFVASPHRQRGSNIPAHSASQDAQNSESSARASKILSDAMAAKPASLDEDSSVQLAPADKALFLVKTLSEISAQPGELTLEKADQWKRGIEQLIEQGKAAVPVLEEFFQTNGDIRFDSVAGGNLLEEPTLRIAFLKVLFDIPTPDNVELQERVLQTTSDPDEIALLARQLELQEPGEHRDVIIQAANAALKMANNGGLPGRDASRLTKLLADYGVK
jgi:hypothetical protein